MIEDYELDPVTADLLRRFAEGSDMINHKEALDDRVGQLVDLVYGLDDYTKGVVIIDLLTLVDALGQAITIMQLPKLED